MTGCGHLKKMFKKINNLFTSLNTSKNVQTAQNYQKKDLK